jgi:hypothetical protein
VFIKGVVGNERATRALAREAAINPYVTAVTPELLWQVEAAGWSVLGFEYIPGRRVDYSPGSPDITKVIRTLTTLGDIACPDLQLPYLEARMANHTPAEQLWRFTGNALLHTDLNPSNVRISGDRAYLLDWAVPTRGITWSGAADLVLRLITCGHTPATPKPSPPTSPHGPPRTRSRSTSASGPRKRPGSTCTAPQTTAHGSTPP